MTQCTQSPRTILVFVCLFVDCFGFLHVILLARRRLENSSRPLFVCSPWEMLKLCFEVSVGRATV